MPGGEAFPPEACCCNYTEISFSQRDPLGFDSFRIAWFLDGPRLTFCWDATGFLSPRPPPRNTLHAILSDALRKFTSIRSLKVVPATFHEGLFLDTLKTLQLNSQQGMSSLRELVLNSSCTSDEEKVSLLTGVTGLSKLALHGPGRVVLEHLPGWLSRNADTLRELHLLVSVSVNPCRPVSPNLLPSFTREIAAL